MDPLFFSAKRSSNVSVLAKFHYGVPEIVSVLEIVDPHCLVVEAPMCPPLDARGEMDGKRSIAVENVVTRAPLLLPGLVLDLGPLVLRHLLTQ